MNLKNRILNLITYRNLKIIVFGMLSLRILFVLMTDEFNTIEDYKIAVNIAEGNGFVLINDFGPTAMKAPIYPYFLSLFIYIFGSSAIKIIALTQHFMMAFVPFLLYRIGTKIRNENIGLIAAFICIFFPPLFYYPNVMEITSLFIFLFALTFWCYLKAIDKFNSKTAAMVGILSSLLVLTQPVILPIAITAIVYLIYRNMKRDTVLLVVCFLSFQAVWTYRNYIEFDKFIHVKSPFWMIFYLGYLPENLVDKKFNILHKDLKIKMDSLINTTNDVDMEIHYKEAFFELYKQNPRLYFEKSLRNLISYWWIPPRHIDNYSLEFLAVRVIPLSILHLLTIIGLPILFRNNRAFFIFLILIFVYFTLVYCLTNPANIRYKLDIEWLQFFAAAEALRQILKSKSPLERGFRGV